MVYPKHKLSLRPTLAFRTAADPLYSLDYSIDSTVSPAKVSFTLKLTNFDISKWTSSTAKHGVYVGIGLGTKKIRVLSLQIIIIICNEKGIYLIYKDFMTVLIQTTKRCQMLTWLFANIYGQTPQLINLFVLITRLIIMMFLMWMEHRTLRV